MFGILNLYKPLNCTSHDVVAQVRRKLQFKKVGHAGTLDPLAEGILPVCVGQATRLIEYLPSDKHYRAWVTFGQTTPTWDAEGALVPVQPGAHLTVEHVEALLGSFRGIIEQQVPPHAAVHVNGKKLYEYARKGIEVTLPVRATEIFSLTLVALEAAGSDHPTAVLDIHCASGTYIRSIAKALGDASGCGAYLSKLVRTAHGRFTVPDSISLSEFLAAEEPTRYLLNPVPYLAFPQLPLSPALATKVRHGMKLQAEDLPAPIQNNRLYLLIEDDVPVAVATAEGNRRLKPLKVLQLQP